VRKLAKCTHYSGSLDMKVKTVVGAYVWSGDKIGSPLLLVWGRGGLF